MRDLGTWPPLLACLLALLLPPIVHGATVEETLPEFNGEGAGAGGLTETPIGTFAYSIPAGEEVISASISGAFGNSSADSSASGNLFIDGVLVATCLLNDPCWLITPDPVPWSYDFQTGELSSFNDGSADFTYTQSALGVMRLGETTLTLETAPVDTCGDGTQDPGEGCDDGNDVDGDCCSSSCTKEPNDDPCSDGDACTLDDTCQDGVCVAGPLDDCDDLDPCTADTCDPALSCQNTLIQGCVTCGDPSECDNQNACDGLEDCVGGFCQPGSPPDCNDGVPCTDDSCDAAAGCVNTPNDANCSDGDSCTEDLCDAAADCRNDVIPMSPCASVDMVPGKRLLIKNRENESKNRIVFVSRPPDVAMGAMDSVDDPRCEASGGGGGRIVVRSLASGEEITQDLPCESWSLIKKGGNPKGYRYLDAGTVHGPCRVVVIRDQRLVKAVCVGRGATPLDYTLQEGQQEAPVRVMIRTGSSNFYCAMFSASSTLKDGTNGKKFLATNAPEPGACQ